MFSSSSSSSASSSSESDEYEVRLNDFSLGKRFELRIDLDFYDEAETIKRFRLSKRVIRLIAGELGETLEPQDNRGYPLSTTQQLLVALRYYATGSFQLTVGDLIGIHQTTAGRIIHRVSAVIASMAKRFIKMPSTVRERRISKTNFFNLKGIPHCIGAIDCTHIPIRSPGGDQAELFRNRKGYFSINTQAICDADCKFIEITARYINMNLKYII